jgi:predicted transcriptional regulator
MATERANDLQAFKTFIDTQLARADGAELKLDEALARWEHESETDEERNESLSSIRQGLADPDAGRTIPAREVVAELRKKFGLTASMSLQENPDEWAQRLHEWVASQPVRANMMDDSRESIYSTRGE